MEVLLGPWGSSWGSQEGLRALPGPAVGFLDLVEELKAMRGWWWRGSRLSFGHRDGRCGYGPALSDTRPPPEVLGGTGCPCGAVVYRKGNRGVFFLVFFPESSLALSRISSACVVASREALGCSLGLLRLLPLAAQKWEHFKAGNLYFGSFRAHFRTTVSFHDVVSSLSERSGRPQKRPAALQRVSWRCRGAVGSQGKPPPRG